MKTSKLLNLENLSLDFAPLVVGAHGSYAKQPASLEVVSRRFGFKWRALIHCMVGKLCERAISE